MPSRPKQPCSVTGCPELVDKGRCPEHEAIAAARRKSPAQRGYDSRWRRTRREFVKVFPRCCVPDCGKPTKDVDHIDRLGPLGPRGHDWSNLRPYCHAHHSSRTQTDPQQRSGWNAR